MSVTTGPRLGLMLDAAVGDAHPNEFRTFLRGVDAMAQISAKSRTTAAQPGSPTNGDIYILPSGATGTDWGGKAAGTIAYYTTRKTTTSGGSDSTSVGWDFIAPKRGFYSNVEDEGDACYRYDGSNWVVFYKEGTWTPTPTNLTGTGITYSAKYVQNGSKADFAITVSGTGLQSTVNSTRLSLPFTNARISIACADNGSNAGGVCEVSGGTVYLPTMGSTTQINVSGSIYTN